MQEARFLKRTATQAFFPLSQPGRSWGAFALAIFCICLAAPIQAGSLYGIDDYNNIWEIDPEQKTDKIVVSGSNYGLTQFQKSNSFAYATIRNDMFFTYSGTGTGVAGLYYWNHTTGGNAITQVLNATTSVSGTTPWSLMAPTDPANAAYYQDGYWFFNGNSGKTSQLNKLSFTYTSGTITPSSVQTWTISNLPTNNTFGDIAISATTGILYANTVGGKLYSVDLVGLSGTTGSATTALDVTGVVGGNPSLQNAFSGDYATLYATQFNNRTWYTENLATGALTTIRSGTSNWTTTVGFRDLGGSALTPVVPEIDPTYVGSVIAMLLGSLGLLERRFHRQPRCLLTAAER